MKSYIGFAIRSNNVIIGADKIISERKKLFVIVVSDSINRTSMSKIIKHSDSKNVPLIMVNDEIIKDIVTLNKCKAIAITDKSLANAVIDNTGVSV